MCGHNIGSVIASVYYSRIVNAAVHIYNVYFYFRDLDPTFPMPLQSPKVAYKVFCCCFLNKMQTKTMIEEKNQYDTRT